LPTVGEILRTEREKQGLTVKDIEKATSIRALYIQAIEDGKYDVLPGEVYLKGFMRNYASFLGLDAQHILDAYRASLPDQAAPPAPAATNPALAPKTEQNRSREKEKRSSAGRWLIALVVVAIVAGGAWAAMNFLNPSAPQPAKPPQAQVTPPQAPPQPAQPAAPPKPVTPAAPIVVNAKYTAPCWTYVVAAGRELYEGIPQKGENMTWNATQSMTVRLGNAAGVELTYNGQPQGRLGGEGDVITRTFSANTTSTTTPR
jgi:cytoskeletal protein RodZ